jgi:hypothetical protein
MQKILDLIKSSKSLLWLTPFVLIIYLSKIEGQKLLVEKCEKFKREAFLGKIEMKYIDKKNHNYQMLVISKSNGRDSSLYDHERSGFWDFVQVNDSIEKKENSYEIYIINRDTTFILIYDYCK